MGRELETVKRDTDTQSPSPNTVLERMGRADRKTKAYWKAQDKRDKKLTKQAGKRLAQYNSPGGPQRPDRQQVDARFTGAASPAARIGALLQGHNGVVIGGNHNKSPLWGFIIGNLDTLRAQGVRTIYLESLRDDSHQALVDEYLSGATNAMSRELASYAEQYDEKWKLENRGLKAFLTALRGRGIAVKGIDGRPARIPDAADIHAGYLRAAKMNTYAEQAVRHDQTKRGNAVGRFIMEVGTKHATTHEAPTAPFTEAGAEFSQPFPGMSDLLGIPPVELNEDGSRLQQLP
ncbi:hypothetical protein ABZZ80_34010 [Streptomyces sp. NPDC006356]